MNEMVNSTMDYMKELLDKELVRILGRKLGRISFLKVNSILNDMLEFVVSVYDSYNDIARIYVKYLKGIYNTLYSIYDKHSKKYVVGNEYLIVMSSTNRRCENCTNVINTRLVYFLYEKEMTPNIISLLYTYNDSYITNNDKIITTQDCCIPLIIHQLLTKLIDGYNLTTEMSHIMKTPSYNRDGTFEDKSEKPESNIIEMDIVIHKILASQRTDNTKILTKLKEIIYKFIKNKREITQKDIDKITEIIDPMLDSDNNTNIIDLLNNIIDSFGKGDDISNSINDLYNSLDDLNL